MIPVNKPFITSEDIDSVIKSLSDGWVSGDSPVVRQFEEQWSAYCGRKYGIAVSNGTIAIDLAFESLNLLPGDEVLVPSFSIISCINYLIRNHITPIFVDSNPSDWNMDLADLRSKITEKTKAILVAHIYGLAVDMDSVIAIAEEFNLDVIEDAAEAHGLKYKGKICGSFGLLSTFSFYSNKNVTCGEGGMILTDNPDLAEELRELRNLNFRSGARFISDKLGYNYRLSSMQAALGLSQMKRIDKTISRRIEIGDYYNKGLSSLSNLQLPIKMNNFSVNNYWVFGIVLSGPLQNKRILAADFLTRNGVDTRPFFQSLHLQPVLKDYGLGEQTQLPVVENLSSSGLYLPNSLSISKEEQDYVIRQVGYMVDWLEQTR